MPDPFFAGKRKAKAKRKPSQTKSGCQGCPLRSGCNSPEMAPYGEGRMGILVVGEAPGAKEDECGRPFVGRAGQFFRAELTKLDIDLDRDCLTTNVVQCRPPDNRTPNDDEVDRCRPRLEKQIEEFEPSLIIALGTPAIQAVLRDAPSKPNATLMHGRVVPNILRGCWVACSFHPSYFVREKGRFDGRFREALSAGLTRYEEAWTDHRLDPGKYEIIPSAARLRAVLAGLGKAGPVAFDYEATCLNPWSPKAKLLTAAFADSPDFGYCIPIGHPHAMWKAGEEQEVKEVLAHWLAGPTEKVIQNWQFEERWSIVHLGTSIANVVADTMIAEHVLDNRRGVTGQAFQEYVRFGEADHKNMVVVSALEREFLDTVARYNVLDVRYDIRIHQEQEREL